MSGVEIPGAAGVVGKAAAKTLKNSGVIDAALADLAKSEPALKSAAKDLAFRTAVKERAKALLYVPLGLVVGVRRGYFDEDFLVDVGEKLASIPEEHLQTPATSVVAQAIEGLQYSVDDPDLKEMYLNLIASAADDRRGAHAAFVTIIRQLDAEEARWLQKTLAYDQIQIAEIRVPIVPNGWRVAARNVIGMTRDDTDVVEEFYRLARDQMPLWVDNWVRLGLFTSHYDRHVLDEGSYDYVQGSPNWESALELAASYGTTDLTFERGLIMRTDFGEAFHVAVIAPEVVQDETTMET